MVGGTFSITNGGVFGSLLSTPIINPPQASARRQAGGWEPNPLMSLRTFMPCMTTRDGASGVSACDERLSPHFL